MHFFFFASFLFYIGVSCEILHVCFQKWHSEDIYTSASPFMYDQGTQDGCSLGLCTFPAQPVPASHIPYSRDGPFYTQAQASDCFINSFRLNISTRRSKGQWGACPLLVSLVNNEPTVISSPITGNLPLPKRSEGWGAGQSRTLLQSCKFSPSIKPLSLWGWFQALSLVLKLGKYRACRPVGGSPTPDYNKFTIAHQQV